jgi:hypothetical protein
MLLKELVNKSWYGTIGYISSQKDLETLERFIHHNQNILKEYINILVATNYSNPSYIKDNHILWKRYFPNCVLIDSPLNRGHSHGYTDLDNLIIDYCKENNIEWLCKSANDVFLLPEMLNINIKEADFYYLNGIGYGGIIQYNFDIDKILSQDFFPQTNFYFINTSKIDYLNNKLYLDETYQHTQSLPEYNGKAWEYIEGWSCEGFLKECVERNSLFKYHLISQEKYITLIKYIIQYNIHDPSHKNLLIEGICHLAFPDNPIIEI